MKTAKILIPAALLALLTVIALALPVGAMPPSQDLPTPTPYPVENTPYTLTTVGGAEETLTVPGLEAEGITIGETSVTSFYPRGMEFIVTAESTGGDIQDVILFQRYAHGSGTRVVAEFDPERNAWVAYPWDTGDNQPAWTHFNFYWRVRDASGVSIETEPTPVDYSDPTRPWYRMESEHVILYWFGFGDDDPDAIAQHMADVMAATHPRRVAGFGRALSYKPMAIVYPSREALAETSGANVERTRVAGFTSSDLGVSVQLLRDTSLVPGNENCIWATQPEDWTMERRINTIYSTTSHEVTHLYQYDILGGPLGPEWWTEGVPEWFSYAPGMYDQRLRNLATLQDIPSLESGAVGSDLTQADGCYALSYDVGPSFINYLLTNYGGPETHRQIAELMRANSSIYEAVETVTGKPFLDIENEWRAYLGFPALDITDIDPSAGLEPVLDPVAAVGDMVTLPAVPVMPVVHANAGPNQPTSGQCFANTTVEILQVGSLDGVDYYQVDCMGQIGWMDRGELVGPGN